MSRAASSPPAANPLPQSQVWLVFFHVVGVLVGLGAAALVGYQLLGLGRGLATGSPLVHDVLALDGGLGASPTGPAASLLAVAALAGATAGAAALLAGSAAALWLDHRRSAHRLTTAGLWIVMVVCLVAMLPLGGYPFGDPSVAPAGPPGFEWHPAPKTLALAAALGLLLASITSHPFRRAGDRVH